MGTTREEIREWLEHGKEQGATHMIVVCDTFSHEEYPVFVLPGVAAKKVCDQYNGPNMQRVMEVYSYGRDLDQQLADGRCFNLD